MWSNHGLFHPTTQSFLPTGFQEPEEGLTKPAAGQALEQKAKDVDTLAAEIKRRFGV